MKTAATTTITAPAILAQVLAAASVGVEPTETSHLVGLGASASPYALRHAIKVRAGESAEPLERLLVPADPSVSRWLVWLGEPKPPAPPTHVRVSLVDTADGLAALVKLAVRAGFTLPTDRQLTGLMFPVYGGEALYVTSNVAGQAVATVAHRGVPEAETASGGATEVEAAHGNAWREAQVYEGSRVDDHDLRLAGLTAAPYHRQLLPVKPPEERLIVLVRPHRSVAP